MKLLLRLLPLICLLSGCFDPVVPVREPEEPAEPEVQEQEIDPLNLKAKVENLESLPESMPQSDGDLKCAIKSQNPIDSEADIEGDWFGGIFSTPYSRPDKRKRIYLQLNKDRTFAYGCVINRPRDKEISRVSSAQGNLKLTMEIKGKYYLEGAELSLEVDQSIEDLDSIDYLCSDRSWWQGKKKMVVPARLLNEKRLVLFKDKFLSTKIYLVKNRKI